MRLCSILVMFGSFVVLFSSPGGLRQQSLLAEIGRSAVQTWDLRQIVQRATELCA
jgi:hypothetical protein